LVLMAGCPGDTTNPPDPDGPIQQDGPDFPDLGSDLQLGDQLTDQPFVHEGPYPDGPPPPDGPGGNPCTAKTNDGIALNPGCDPDFKANGPTALGQFIVVASGNPAWLFTTGTKWWVFDTTANGGQGAFTAGGADFAATLKTLQPACTAKAGPAFLNPGCDPTFQANGPTTVGAIKDASSGKTNWFFSSGKKWWVFNSTAGGGAGAFTAAGVNIANNTLALPPPCRSLAPDGTPINPGCDVTYQANGPTAWGEFTNPGTGQQAWLFVSQTKFWLFDPTGTGTFTGAGADIAQALSALQPGCTAKAADGSFLNPGCDPTFKVNGPTAVGEFTSTGAAGTTTWIFTEGKKYWLFDPAGTGNGAFTAAGADIASVVRLLAP